MASVTVRVAGLSELGKNLATFTKEVKGKILRRAAREAANEVRDTAKAIFTSKWKRGDEPLHVIDAIATRRMSKASSPGREYFAVGVFKLKNSAKTGKAYKYANTRHNVRKQRVGKGYEVDPPAFYWKFLEFGTVRGIRAGPFIAPAFDQKKAGAPETMRRVLEDGMDKATRKLAKAKAK